MKLQHAKQIADLLNSRNQLVKKYDAIMVVNAIDNFIYELKDDVVIACVEAERVQWYQWEIRHLTVASESEGRGFGSLMIRRAEERAKNGGAKIVQCTIRVGNAASEQVFERNGYRRVSEFFYSISGNRVAVWQKVVADD